MAQNMNAKIDEWLQKRKAKRPGLDRAFVVSVPRAGDRISFDRSLATLVTSVQSSAFRLPEIGKLKLELLTAN